MAEGTRGSEIGHKRVRDKRYTQGWGYSNDEIMDGLREGRRTNAEIRERFLAAGVNEREIERLMLAHPAVGYDAGK